MQDEIKTLIPPNFLTLLRVITSVCGLLYLLEMSSSSFDKSMEIAFQMRKYPVQLRTVKLSINQSILLNSFKIIPLFKISPDTDHRPQTFFQIDFIFQQIQRISPHLIIAFDCLGFIANAFLIKYHYEFKNTHIQWIFY